MCYIWRWSLQWRSRRRYWNLHRLNLSRIMWRFASGVYYSPRWNFATAFFDNRYFVYVLLICMFYVSDLVIYESISTCIQLRIYTVYINTKDISFALNIARCKETAIPRGSVDLPGLRWTTAAWLRGLRRPLEKRWYPRGAHGSEVQISTR